MVKLKLNKLIKLICDTCKGNGFLKVKDQDQQENIHQCWDCDSEGEYYETVEHNHIVGSVDSGSDTLQ